MKNQSNTTKKRKSTKKPLKVLVAEPTRSSVSFRYILSLPFRIITFPFYMIYLLLFKIPDVPTHVVGILRFSFFVWISLQHRAIEMFVNDSPMNYNVPVWLPSLALGAFAIIMLINLFLSFMEIFGFYKPEKNDPSVSGYSFVDSGQPSSKYDSFDEVFEYRDSLLRAKHTPDKIKELKKTGFITKERLVEMGSSEEVSEALELANSQMRAMHTPDKYKFLQGMFSGK